jgi:hypothetical protein
MMVPAIAPAASASVLARILGAQSGHGAGVGAGAGIVGSGAAGKTVAATLAAKALTGAAVLVTAAAGVAGVRAVMPPSQHSNRQSVSTHTTGTGAALEGLTRVSGPAMHPSASTLGTRRATASDHSALGSPPATRTSGGAASAGRGFNAGRHVQRAGAVGPGGGSSPATGGRARGPAASSSAPSKPALGNPSATRRASPARDRPAPGVRPTPRAAAPPGLG